MAELQTINESGDLTEIKLGGTTDGDKILTSDEIDAKDVLLVPYTGATGDVDLGDNTIDTKRLLQSNNGGSIFIGEDAGGATLSGGENVYIGYNAGGEIEHGNNIIAIGVNSGGNLITGGNAIAIGNETTLTDGATNEIALGANVIANGSNTATILNNEGTDVYMGQNGQATTIQTVVKLIPSTAPTTPTEGMIYSGTDHHLYYYNGSSWKQLDN